MFWLMGENTDDRFTLANTDGQKLTTNFYRLSVPTDFQIIGFVIFLVCQSTLMES